MKINPAPLIDGRLVDSVQLVRRTAGDGRLNLRLAVADYNPAA